jgi:hypothetical protein
MPLTNAQKQRRYRERHLGPDGDLERVTLYLGIAARDRLDRLTHHYRYSLTQLVEELAVRTERSVRARLRPKDLKALTPQVAWQNAHPR